MGSSSNIALGKKPDGNYTALLTDSNGNLMVVGTLGGGSEAVQISNGTNNVTITNVSGKYSLDVNVTDVTIDAANDSIAIKSGANTLAVQADGSINVNTAAPVGGATSANQTSELTKLDTIITNTNKIPALGQALAAASTPVVLTAAQLTTLTPIAGNLETTQSAINTKIPSGLTVTANRLQVELPSGGTGLTNTELRASAVPVSLTSTTITGSVSTVGPLTDTQLRAAVVPVSLTSTTITGSVAVTGPLTDTQLRATPVPVSGTVTSNIGTTNGLALDATLTGGTQKAIARTAAKGSTVAADLTSTPVDANTQALDVQIKNTSVAVTGPLTDTQLRASAVPVSGTVTVNALTNASIVKAQLQDNSGAAVTLGQQLAAASLPVVLTAAQITTLTPLSTVTANAGTNLNTSALNLETTQTAMSAKLPATLGQKAMAASMAVTLASDQASIPVAATLAAETTKVIGTVNIAAAQTVGTTQTDTAVSGTISATDVLAAAPGGAGVFIATAPTVSSFVAAAVPGGTSEVDLQITGTATGTYYFEGSSDSTTGSDGNWIAINLRQTGIINTTVGYSTTVNGMFRGSPSGFKYTRVRNVGGTTPSNPIIFRYSSGGGTVFLNASIPSGSNIIGKTGIDQTTPGTTNLVSIGTNGTVAINAALPAGTNTIGAVNIAAAQTLAAVTTVSAVTAITNALPAGTNKLGTVDIATAAATAKGTQGTNAVPTQDLKDAGRNPIHFYTVIPVLSTATDTLQSLTGTKSGATVAATTTPAVVTAGKNMRITRFAATYIATATSGYGIVRLRFNTAGVVAITSPVAATMAIGASAPTTANATASEEAVLEEGWEFAAATGIGISVQGFSAVTATAVGYVLVSVTGYEY